MQSYFIYTFANTVLDAVIFDATLAQCFNAQSWIKIRVLAATDIQNTHL